LALLAGLLAFAGDSYLTAAGEPQMPAAASGKETIEVAAAKSQAAPEPDSQESPAIREKDNGTQVSQAVMTALSKIKAGQGKSGGKEHASSREVLTVTPGRNMVVSVAGDHLNRIVTPFEKPAVNTVSKVKHQVYANAVYVSLGMDDGPAALFITEDGEEDSAISLTLEPKEIAPREVRLKLDGNFPVSAGGVGAPAASQGSGKAAKWEKSQAYVDAIEQVLLRTARGEVPPGYNLRDYFNYDPQVSTRLPVTIEPRQVLEGHSFLVVIARMTNRSSSTLVISEEAFYRPGVRAVAVWPRVRLEPKQTSELYVVHQRSTPSSPRTRPSVLNLLPGEVRR
jgi:conjugal transfer pilus assembly protein TraK